MSDDIKYKVERARNLSRELKLPDAPGLLSQGDANFTETRSPVLQGPSLKGWLSLTSATSRVPSSRSMRTRWQTTFDRSGYRL